jgi:adenosylmethionine-8-amino-7-oxononanoate aminotransferase
MKEYVREAPLVVREGRGCWLTDAGGRKYLDGVSSLWCNIHGHRRGEIDAAVKAQLDKIAHSTLLGVSNEPAIRLAKKLAELAPPGLTKVFYSDDGSTAVEVALKMAFQYWQHRGGDFRKKTRFVALRNGYHGDTIGAMSVGGIELFHATFRPLLFKTYLAPSPYCYRCEFGRTRERCRWECVGALEKILRAHGEKIAAMIVEPLVQAAGGMIVAPSGYLKRAERLCRKHKVLLIADEVATGFGRTGKMFACEHEDVRPDLLACSKGMTGGYMPLAATLCAQEIYEAFLGSFEARKTFFHGHTFTGNQLGCAAALASLRIFEKERLLERLAPKAETLRTELEALRGLPAVGNVRQCGLIAGVELVQDRETRRPFDWRRRVGWQVCLAARKRGLLIRPLGDVIVIMPPLAISSRDLKWMVGTIGDSIRAVTQARAPHRQRKAAQ